MVTTFQSVAEQLLSGAAVIELDGQSFPIRRTSSKRLTMVIFRCEGREYSAIEQNPEKPSRWGQLARDGHRVVQFKDVASNRFVAVSIDGKVREYGKMK